MHLSPVALAGAVAVAVAASIITAPYAAAQPPGQIVVERDAPVHDAFRTGDRGKASTIATAPDEGVLTATGLPRRAPQSVPDAVLRNIAGHMTGTVTSTAVLRTTAATTSAPSLAPATALQATSGLSNHLGAAIAGNIGALNAALSGLAGLK